MTAFEQQLINISNHTYDDWTKSLQETPPQLDMWQFEQVGSKNEGPYRSMYESLVINECNEPLVCCNNYGLVNKDYYLYKLFDQLPTTPLLDALQQKLLWPFAWVRQSVAEKLVAADKELRKHDLFLYITSGWRHPAIQKLAATSATTKLGTDEVKRLFATKSPHATGGAVDIELYSLQTGSSLSFSYPGDEYGFYNLELKTNLTSDQIKVRNIRRILFHVLSPLGFTIHPGEFWHFGLGDPLSSFLARQEAAIFGPIDIPTSTQLTHFQV